MAGSVNKVILVGNLGKDPEIRSFQNGGRVASSRSPHPKAGKTNRPAKRKTAPNGTVFPC